MFNIRVYGIIINEQKQVLVSDEFIRGAYVTKFPGGGLEFGEGTRDCLKREMKEELNIEAEIGEHIYTTDFYQRSAFNPEHQIVSIYYHVKPLETITVPFKQTLFDFEPHQIADPKGEAEVFRLIDWNVFSEDALTLPIDKVVARLLKGNS
ncbi:NUDIX domain-containing protein [Lacibacter sp. H407]|uniref:NUDIX domain-containing protein n=1 Tax=Lacibacter sp. H407 TaxID=3133423 RepID=UPI0030BDBBF2